MKKIFILFCITIFFLVSSDLRSQNWTEGFEGIDSLHLPAGWSKWHRSNYPILPFTDWTIRDTGRSLPGLQTATSKSHSGLNAIGVSWWSGVDTLGIDTTDIADEWLVTRRVHVWSSLALMSFWVAGGSPSYKDSLQIWLSTVDSTPQSFTEYYNTLVLGPGPYGVFNQDFIPLDQYIGQNVWVGFRYFMNVSVDGYFVHLDDFEVQNPIGIVPIGNEIPIKFDLKQNYPNPFNPVTNIEFDIARTSNVKLVIFNMLGQEVRTPVNEELAAGSYRVDFNAGNLPSGTYFYRLTAGDFVKTNKMVIVK
jgi:hypothetical protein